MGFVRWLRGRRASQDPVKMAEEIVNTHNYAICELCQADEPRNCKSFCLPAEMLRLLVDEQDSVEILRMVDNVEDLFTD